MHWFPRSFKFTARSAGVPEAVESAAMLFGSRCCQQSTKRPDEWAEHTYACSFNVAVGGYFALSPCMQWGG